MLRYFQGCFYVTFQENNVCPDMRYSVAYSQLISKKKILKLFVRLPFCCLSSIIFPKISVGLIFQNLGTGISVS